MAQTTETAAAVQETPQHIIKLEISNEYVIGQGVSVGAVGSHDEVLLEMDFRPSRVWRGTTRRAIFANALGEQRTPIILGDSLLEEGHTEVYLVPVPYEAKTVAGECFLTVEGFLPDGKGGEILRVVTEEAKFRVLPSKLYNGNGGLTPDQSEQLQKEIEGLKDLLDKKIDKVPTAKEGNISTWIPGGNLEDGGAVGTGGGGDGDMRKEDYDPNEAVKNEGGIPDYVDNRIKEAIGGGGGGDVDVSGKMDKVPGAGPLTIPVFDQGMTGQVIDSQIGLRDLLNYFVDPSKDYNEKTETQIEIVKAMLTVYVINHQESPSRENSCYLKKSLLLQPLFILPYYDDETGVEIQVKKEAGGYKTVKAQSILYIPPRDFFMDEPADPNDPDVVAAAKGRYKFGMFIAFGVDYGNKADDVTAYLEGSYHGVFARTIKRTDFERSLYHDYININTLTFVPYLPGTHKAADEATAKSLSGDNPGTWFYTVEP